MKYDYTLELTEEEYYLVMDSIEDYEPIYDCKELTNHKIKLKEGILNR